MPDCARLLFNASPTEEQPSPPTAGQEPSPPTAEDKPPPLAAEDEPPPLAAEDEPLPLTREQPAGVSSSLDAWLGAFLVFYSGSFLSVALSLSDYPGPVLRAGAWAWVAAGLALFLAGTLVYNRGFSFAPSRVALATAAALLAFRVLYGALAYGNPFAGAAASLARVEVGVEIAADLVLVLAGVWFVVAVARTAPADRAAARRFARAGLIYLASFALQEGLAPLLSLVLYLTRNPGVIQGLASSAWSTYAVNLLPVAVKGLAGGLGLVAAWTTARAWRATRAAVWAIGLWALGEFLVIVSLWSSWTGPAEALAPALAQRVRTTLLVGLPALTLLGLASAVRRTVDA